jgi:hypothetical protein
MSYGRQVGNGRWIDESMNINFKAFENTLISKIFYIPSGTSTTYPTI